MNEPRFNGAYSKDNLLKIKAGAYVINLDKYADIGTHWVVLWVNNNNITYFDSFGVEHIPEEIKAFINNNNNNNNNNDIKTNFFRIQAYDSIMCQYIGFVDFILAGKKFTDYTNLFSPHDFKKNDNIVLNYFKYG